MDIGRNAEVGLLDGDQLQKVACQWRDIRIVSALGKWFDNGWCGHGSGGKGLKWPDFWKLDRDTNYKSTTVTGNEQMVEA